MKYAYLAAMLVIVSSSAPLAIAYPDQNADNTGRNVRDRDGLNPTAQDQSNSKSAVKTTAKLRREILRTKGLSVNAQNVKVIDENGCTVLRGPVNNEQEKATINDLAHRCCGANVRDEMEVKTP